MINMVHHRVRSADRPAENRKMVTLIDDCGNPADGKNRDGREL